VNEIFVVRVNQNTDQLGFSVFAANVGKPSGNSRCELATAACREFEQKKSFRYVKHVTKLVPKERDDMKMCKGRRKKNSTNIENV